MPAPYQAEDIAAWFLGSIDREAGDSITHLKLQKLVYYAQAWSLALRGQPLFDEDMQAWAHGPVAESVYQRHRGAGWEALPVPESVPEVDEETEDFLSSILATYGNLAAKQLENMTHAERPWIDARNGISPEARSNAPISKELMTEYYRDLYSKAERGEDDKQEVV